MSATEKEKNVWHFKFWKPELEDKPFRNKKNDDHCYSFRMGTAMATMLRLWQCLFFKKKKVELTMMLLPDTQDLTNMLYLSVKNKIANIHWTHINVILPTDHFVITVQRSPKTERYICIHPFIPLKGETNNISWVCLMSN